MSEDSEDMVPWRADWPRHLALMIGVAASAFGAAVLTAWYAHFLPLIQLSPVLPPLTRQGALAQLLLGASLACLASRRKRAAAVCAGVALLLAVLVCLEYALGWDLGIDQILGGDYLAKGSRPPGRISPVAALSYLGAGLALLAMSTRNLARSGPAIAGIIASMLIAFGSVTVLAYLMGHTVTYAWGHFRHISLQAGAVLVLLGSGIMALSGRESRDRLPEWLPLGIGFGLSVGALGVSQVLIMHTGGAFPLISNMILAGGILGAGLVATAVYMAQKATLRSHELQESEERFRGVFEQGPIGVTLMGRDYRLMKPNAAFCRMMGYSAEELTNMTVLDLTHPDDLKPTVNMVEELFRFGAPHLKLEKRYVKKGGDIMWGSVTTSAIHDDGGKLLFSIGMIEDITERKRAEEEMRTLSQRLSQAIRFGSMSVWEWDPRTNCFVWDDSAFALAGIHKVVPLSYEQWTRLVFPEDLPSAEAALHSIVHEKAQESVEYRIIRPDGDLRYVYGAGGPILDGQGNVARVVGIAVDITERKRAEDEMRALSERLKLATRSASMGVWDWNLHTDQAIWDDTMFEIFDIPKQASVSRADWARVIHSSDLPRVASFLDTVVDRRTQDSMEFRIMRRDGSLRHVAATGGAVLDDFGNATGVVGIVMDITERKRTEEELHTLSERLALATQIASIGVWDWDLVTNLEVWDDAAFEMFDMPKVNPVQHEDFVRHIHPDDRARVRAATDRVIHKKAQESLEFRILRPDGSLRYLSVAAGGVQNERGEVTRMVGIVIDVTGRKQMEAKLEANREQMIASARLSALGMMAGGIAHEINNPLSIIHAMASDLEEMVDESGAASPPVVARKSGIIRETAERIARIVKSLRQISREGAGDDLRPTRLAKILDETLEICRAKFNAHGVALLLPEAIPALRIPCREVQIAQALLNLLQNAFDAVVDQQGERWVRIELGTDDDSVAISVLDSGPGIPPELRSRVMEPFFTTKEVGKGTGLGLSLSKTIAEEHGGKLEYGQENGHTRFSLILPLARQAEAA